MVGRRLPLLCTASGKAYFAFCEKEERGDLLKLLMASDNEQSSLARNRLFIAEMVGKIQADGVATNDGEWAQERHMAAIALPIRRDRHVLACLNVVYLKRAMRIGEAIERYLPSLRAAVSKIEDKLASGEVKTRSDGSSFAT